MFCLIDDKGVIYKPEPEGRGVGEGGEGFDFKLFHKDVCYEGADGGTHSCDLVPAHNTYPGRGSRCWKGRTPVGR